MGVQADGSSGTGGTAAVPADDRFRSLDGLRAVACLLVVFGHCFVHGGRYRFPAGTVFGFNWSLAEILGRCYIGVDVFFILSAFCLSYPLLRRPPGLATDWAGWLRKRMYRIYPPYLAAFALFAVLGASFSLTPRHPLALEESLRPEWRDALAALLLVYPAYNGSFWTLCIEARWYLLLPALLWLYRRPHGQALLCLCAAAGAAFHLLMESRRGWDPVSAGAVGYWIGPLPLFLPTFALGVLLAGAVAVRGPRLAEGARLRLLRAGLIASLAAFGLSSPLVQDLSPARVLPAAVFAFFVVVAALEDPAAVRLLTCRPLLVLGSASYSIYLVHEPFIHLARRATEPLHWPAPVQFSVFQGLLAPALVALGIGFHYFVERPLLEQARLSR